jgi:hypothetical protein
MVLLDDVVQVGRGPTPAAPTQSPLLPFEGARRGQVRWLLKGDVSGQVLFINLTLGLKTV